MREMIMNFAERHNIIAGVCDAEPLPPQFQIANAVPFVRTESRLRNDPQSIFPAAKSVIVIGVGNKKICDAPAPTGADAVPRGKIAAIGAGEDYHAKIKNLLTALADELRLENFQIFVDGAHLPERALAVKAGIAFIARNGFAVSEKFGSYFNIGYILTDAEIEPDTPIAPNANGHPCLNCGRCLNACPTAALAEKNPFLCVSYFTMKKGELSPDEREAIARAGYIYGCDICQQVCPLNENVPAEQVSVDELYPRLDEISQMTGAEFKRRFAHTAANWRGAENLRRNAVFISQSKWEKLF